MRIVARRQKPEARINFGRSSDYRLLAAGFTLVELLTVIIIIAVLIGILLPTVARIRRAARTTAVKAQIQGLQEAIDAYYADFHAYPGPVSNQVMGTAPVYAAPPATSDYINIAMGVNKGSVTNLVTNLTGPENLVLGLIGGLTYQSTTNGNYTAGINYDPTLVGNGANSLNVGLPKRFGAYIDTSDLSSTFISTKNGLYGDDIVPSGTLTDSPVPEILDRYPDKMPILYIRANVGATMYSAPPAGTFSDYNNPVVIDGTDAQYLSNTGAQQLANVGGVVRYAQYDISQIIAYTRSYGGNCIGEGKTPPQYVVAGATVKGTPTHGLNTIGATSPTQTLAGAAGTSTYTYPYPAYPYFKDPNSPAYSAGPPTVLPYARSKDTYILISAGADRIYGTADDITSFGDVKP